MEKLLNHKGVPSYVYCVLAFVFAPVLSTQEVADPNILYVSSIIICTIICVGNHFGLKTNGGSIAAIVFAFSAFFSSVIGYGDFTAVAKTFLYVIFYICVCSISYKRTDLKFMIDAYTLLSIILAVLIILSALLGYTHNESYYYMSRYSIGITGLYKNPNYLASFINIAFFFICISLIYEKKRKLLKAGILGTFIVAIILTGTRAALLESILIIVASLFYNISHSRNKIYSIILVLIFSAIIIAYSASLQNLWDLFLANRQVFSDEGREVAWGSALSYFFQSPLFGQGLDSWNSMRGSDMTYLHNIFLELLLNQGLFGMIPFLVLLLFGIKKIKREDKWLIYMLLFFSGFPLLFQNGVVSMNVWRFVTIVQVAILYSLQSENGILYDLFEKR